MRVFSPLPVSEAWLKEDDTLALCSVSVGHLLHTQYLYTGIAEDLLMQETESANDGTELLEVTSLL